jgi:hypothetical protein
MAFHRSSRPRGTGDERRDIRPIWRWVLRSVVGLIASVAVAITLVVVLLHDLARPWLKRRIQDVARTAAGIEIEYGAARVDLLSGAEIQDLVVRSPAEVRSVAPELFRARRIELRWSPGALLSGGRPVVRLVAVADVSLTVTVDEGGRTSLDLLSPPHASAPAKGPEIPLSRLASTLLATAPPVSEVDLERVALTRIRTEKGAVASRTALRGLSAVAQVLPAGPGEKGWRVLTTLGRPALPLTLELEQALAGGEVRSARAAFWLTAESSSSEARAAFDLRMLEQTFAANLVVDRGIHAEGGARFDPAAARTTLTLDRLEAADGAATARASIDVSDAHQVMVHHADGDIDVARLIGWLPAGLVPVTAERARARWAMDAFAVAPAVRLSDGGAVAIDAEVSNVRTGQGSKPLRVAAAKVSARAQPGEGGAVLARGSAELTDLDVEVKDGRIAAHDLHVSFDGQRAEDGLLAGHADVTFGRLERGGSTPAAARDGRLELRVERLRPDSDHPLATRGDVGLSLAVASLDARSSKVQVIAEGLALQAHAGLEGHPPYAAQLEAPVSRLRVVRADGTAMEDAPARVDLGVDDVQLDVDNALQGRSVIHATLGLGGARVALDATKGADAVDFALHAAFPDLECVRAFLPPTLAEGAPWKRMSLAVRSEGHLQGLGGGAPTLRQETAIELARPAFRTVGAAQVSLKLRSRGTTLEEEIDADVRARALSLGDAAPHDEHATLWVSANRLRPAMEFRLATEGRATTALSGSVSFDASRRAVAYGIDGHFADLAALAPFAARASGLDAFDLSRLEVTLSAHGALLGVVQSFSPDGAVRLEPDPAVTAAMEGTTDLRLAHLRWARGDTAIEAPAVRWHGDMRSAGARRTVDSHLEIGTVHLDLGTRDVDLGGIDDTAHVTLAGRLNDPEVDLDQQLLVRSVEQNVVPEYPLGDLSVAVTASGSREGIVHLSDLKASNGRGGTELAAAGNIDLSGGRRSLSLTGALAQDLERLSGIPERFHGRGKVALDASVTSPDLRHLHVRAQVKGEDVSLAAPRSGLEVEGASGEVPVTVSLEVGEHGVAFERSHQRSPYSMLRFADQHPLLTRSGFLSIARLQTPTVTVAPLVGNLEIDQNVFSLRQFEMGIRGGNVTGQCGLEWDGPRSTLELHVRATGVQSSHGEPFDGNIAVAVSASDRTVDGRAEILRIGPRHLLDLLDLQDPLHVDPAYNRIRAALAFGYPDSLRLVFDHGFASAHLQLGGLARLVSIADLRGIPMGPIVDKLLARILSEPDTTEMQ